MSTRPLFFAAALSSAACVHCGPTFQEPVGQTTDRVAPPTAQLATTTSVDAGPDDGGSTDAGTADGGATATDDGADPCGADPPVIAFEGASTSIDERQGRLLRRLVECLGTPPLAKMSVVLIGYTDLVGTVSANLELGLTRAQAVMRHLVSSGLAWGRIVVASAGELQRPRARMGMHAPRVEVLLTQGGPTRPNEAPITRGIDAEGMLPRQRPPSSPAAPATAVRPAPTVRPMPRRP